MNPSIAIPSTAPQTSDNQRQERQSNVAEPLPMKRGEIGFVEGLGAEQGVRTSSPEIVLPERHPADRQAEQEQVVVTRPFVTEGASSSQTSLTSSVDSVTRLKENQLLGIFKCKHKRETPRKIWGVFATTLVKAVIQVLLLAGTVAAWAFTTIFLKHMQDQDGMVPGGQSSTIFIHVVFTIATVGQILFLERRIYRLRAERYNFAHPGELLPRSRRNRRNSVDSTTIAFSPWNRPPLPSYAAVLAQSGARTGDVEDHIIAQQPPPSYGNTRGSVFLLSGHLSEAMRIQRPPSVHSVRSMPERPCSYVSRDEEWEEIQDAERARQLEETLSTLDPGRNRNLT